MAQLSRARRVLVALALSAAVGTLAGAAGAAEGSANASVLRLRAERLAHEGHCDQALPLLERAREKAPGDAQAALLEGECRIRLEKYADAVEPLEAAKRIAPTLAEADLYLGIAEYHQGQLDKAETELDAAAKRLPPNAELELYRGLILLERAKTKQAATALERASTISPQDVEPVASYYAGLAWAGAKDRKRAEASLRRVIAQAPGTVWATQAQAAIKRIEAAERHRMWARATAGVEYDTNVVLKGSGVVLPSEIAHKQDWRGVWALEAGSELWRTPDWSAGLVASYSGSAHRHLNQFNVQYPTLSGWLDRRIDEDTFARLEADAGYAWVGLDPFLETHGVEASLHHDFPGAGTAVAFARWEHDNYLFSTPIQPAAPPGINPKSARNRDGNWWSLGFDYHLPVGQTTVLRVGYTHDRYGAFGQEYSYVDHEIRAGIRQDLPLGFVADLSGSWAYRPFRHPSTFPDPITGAFSNSRRLDKETEADAELERPITKNLTASVRYTYVRNESNVRVFDYRRQIVGGYLTLAFSN